MWLNNANRRIKLAVRVKLEPNCCWFILISWRHATFVVKMETNKWAWKMPINSQILINFRLLQVKNKVVFMNVGVTGFIQCWQNQGRLRTPRSSLWKMLLASASYSADRYQLIVMLSTQWWLWSYMMMVIWFTHIPFD